MKHCMYGDPLEGPVPRYLPYIPISAPRFLAFCFPLGPDEEHSSLGEKPYVGYTQKQFIPPPKGTVKNINKDGALTGITL
jgi:hypothetical protein